MQRVRGVWGNVKGRGLFHSPHKLTHLNASKRSDSHKRMEIVKASDWTLWLDAPPPLPLRQAHLSQCFTLIIKRSILLLHTRPPPSTRSPNEIN